MDILVRDYSHPHVEEGEIFKVLRLPIGNNWVAFDENLLSLRLQTQYYRHRLLERILERAHRIPPPHL
jgi:hypothetical protein